MPVNARSCPTTTLMGLPERATMMAAGHLAVVIAQHQLAMVGRQDPDISRRRGFVGGVWVRTAPSGRFSFQAAQT